MPHFKCAACRTRLHRAAGQSDLVGDLCPECGSLLEPVGALAEVVGFRSITPRDRSGDGGAPGTHQRLAERVHDLTAHRKAMYARALRDAHDAERWIDDGGSFRAAAVALPRPETNC